MSDLFSYLIKIMFNSPTKGFLNLDETIKEIIEFINEFPKHEYRLVIGTDSQPNKNSVDFVNAIVIHRVNSGGRYFWKRIRKEYNYKLQLKARIFTEANLSIELALKILPLVQKSLIDVSIKEIPEFELHVDIGQKGKTKEMIKEIVGMVRGMGFEPKIKPHSYAASTIADKYA